MSSRLVRCESRSIKRGQSVGGAFSIGVCEVPIPRTSLAMALSSSAILEQIPSARNWYCGQLFRVQRPDAVPLGGGRRGGELRDAVEEDLAGRIVGNDRQAVAEALGGLVPAPFAIIGEGSGEGVAQLE